MLRVDAAIVINAPADVVFEFIANPENNPTWQRGMQSCRITSEGQFGQGSTYRQTATFLGKRIDSDFEIVEFVPGRRIKGTTTSGPFPITFTRSAEPLGDDRTHVAALVEGDASGFFRIATPILRWMVQRSVRGDYRRLADHFTPHNA